MSNIRAQMLRVAELNRQQTPRGSKARVSVGQVASLTQSFQQLANQNLAQETARLDRQAVEAHNDQLAQVDHDARVAGQNFEAELANALDDDRNSGGYDGNYTGFVQSQAAIASELRQSYAERLAQQDQTDRGDRAKRFGEAYQDVEFRAAQGAATLAREERKSFAKLNVLNAADDVMQRQLRSVAAPSVGEFVVSDLDRYGQPYAAPFVRDRTVSLGDQANSFGAMNLGQRARKFGASGEGYEGTAGNVTALFPSEAHGAAALIDRAHVANGRTVQEYINGIEGESGVLGLGYSGGQDYSTYLDALEQQGVSPDEVIDTSNPEQMERLINAHSFAEGNSIRIDGDGVAQAMAMFREGGAQQGTARTRAAVERVANASTAQEALSFDPRPAIDPDGLIRQWQAYSTEVAPILGSAPMTPEEKREMELTVQNEWWARRFETLAVSDPLGMRAALNSGKLDQFLTVGQEAALIEQVDASYRDQRAGYITEQQNRLEFMIATANTPQKLALARELQQALEPFLDSDDLWDLREDVETARQGFEADRIESLEQQQTDARDQEKTTREFALRMGVENQSVSELDIVKAQQDGVLTPKVATTLITKLRDEGTERTKAQARIDAVSVYLADSDGLTPRPTNETLDAFYEERFSASIDTAWQNIAQAQDLDPADVSQPQYRTLRNTMTLDHVKQVGRVPTAVSDELASVARAGILGTDIDPARAEAALALYSSLSDLGHDYFGEDAMASDVRRVLDLASVNHRLGGVAA